MSYKNGLTLLELTIVMILIGVVVAFAVPNFRTPNEQASALNARNNLLAIYSAQQNYNNDKGAFCLSGNGSSNPSCTTSNKCADSLTQINCNLSLNMQDDGSYTYACVTDIGSTGTGFSCTATRNGGVTLKLTNVPIQGHGSTATNPTCTGTANWCP